jgi:hypothetical protein
MVLFEVKEYPDGTIAVARREKTNPPVKGLPPYHNQFIIMDSAEIGELKNVIDEYANKTRDK